MYLTELELSESFQQDLMILKSHGEINENYFKDFADNYPGYIHFNQLNDYSLIYANKSSENFFELNTAEIQKLGITFLHSYFHQDTWVRNIPELLVYAQCHDRRQCAIGQFQQIRKKVDADFETFITISTVTEKLKCLMTFEFPVNIFGKMALKMKNILDDNVFLRTNYRKFLLLSKRELEIIRLIGLGFTRNNIIEQLKISKHTFDNHRKHIRQKLEIKTSAELFKYIKAFDLT